ncbi:fibulin-7-like isoform X2 [Mixophyes fleayi]|uniref:fibulin-7-like isoform X2 n=1 Tax=Mixophyes fleayi TaxID=3061075 RepID=UPI003F4DCA22
MNIRDEEHVRISVSTAGEHSTHHPVTPSYNPRCSEAHLQVEAGDQPFSVMLIVTEVTMLKTVLLVSVFLQMLSDCNGQTRTMRGGKEACTEKQEALKVLRQVQKLLTDHEASYLQGLRTLSRRLNHLSEHIQTGKVKDNCPPVKPPRHGRVLGGRLKVGHELHVLCDPGYRLLGSETRTCLDNQTWSGQPAVCTAETAPVRNASSLRPARCSSFYGTQHCVCDSGYVIQAGASCQDVDECGLYQGKAGSRICVHECVNTPGSYHCVCPQGYTLDSQQNSCHDIDECVSDHATCAGGEHCVNLYGGVTCVRPECPRPKQNATYVKTSAHQCERSPCHVGSSSCLEAPHSVSFHYIAIQSQLTVPRVLFTMTAPRSQGDNQRFTIIRGKGQRGLTVQQAGRHRGELVLTKSLTGPAELQVDVEMAEMSPQGLLGKHIFSVTLFVSQYAF